MEIKTYSAKQSQLLAKKLAQHFPLGTVIVLEGPLGSGKTTFTQGFGRGLGIKRAIKSPTYTIVRNYPISSGEFVHIDAYRLEDGGEDTVDIPMFIRPDTITVIEWAQLIQDLLPRHFYRLTFVPQEKPNERLVQFEIVNGSDTQTKLLKQLITQFEIERNEKYE